MVEEILSCMKVTKERVSMLVRGTLKLCLRLQAKPAATRFAECRFSPGVG